MRNANRVGKLESELLHDRQWSPSPGYFNSAGDSGALRPERLPHSKRRQLTHARQAGGARLGTCIEIE